jgi:hypothetical protein
MNNSQIVTKDDFSQSVKRWVTIDTQLKMINDKTKQLREEKNRLSTSICEQMENSGNKNRKILIHDGDLKVHEKKEYSPLTFSFLEEHLGKIMNDASQVDYVIDYLKQQREIKLSNDLKRSYKNNK